MRSGNHFVRKSIGKKYSRELNLSGGSRLNPALTLKPNVGVYTETNGLEFQTDGIERLRISEDGIQSTQLKVNPSSDDSSYDQGIVYDGTNQRIVAPEANKLAFYNPDGDFGASYITFDLTRTAKPTISGSNQINVGDIEVSAVQWATPVNDVRIRTLNEYCVCIPLNFFDYDPGSPIGTITIPWSADEFVMTGSLISTSGSNFETACVTFGTPAGPTYPVHLLVQGTPEGEGYLQIFVKHFETLY